MTINPAKSTTFLTLLLAAASIAQQATFAVVEHGTGELGFYSLEGDRVAGVPLGKAPGAMIRSRDGKLAYVISGGIAVIDLAARREVSRLALDNVGTLTGLALNKQGQLLASVRDPDGLLLIDPGNGDVLRKYSVEGQSPSAVTLDPKGEWAYVSNAASSTVDAVLLASGFTRRIVTDASPAEGVFSKDGRLLFISHPQGSSISIIDTQRRIRSGALFPGRGPTGLMLSPDGTALISLSGQAVVFTDLESREESGRIAVGGRPESLGLSPFGSTLFVTVPASDKVMVISLSKRTIVQIVDVPKGARLGVIVPVP